MNNTKPPPLPKELDDLLDTLVTGFASYMKVCDLAPKIMEVAKKHNIDDMTIRNTIITKLAKIGISIRTIQRYMPKELRLHKDPEDRKKIIGFAKLANQENSDKQPSKELERETEMAFKVTNDDFTMRRALFINLREQGMEESIAPKQVDNMVLNKKKLPFDGEPFESFGLSEFFNGKVIDMIKDIFFDEDENDRFIIRLQNENKQLKDKLAALEARLRIN